MIESPESRATSESARQTLGAYRRAKSRANYCMRLLEELEEKARGTEQALKSDIVQSSKNPKRLEALWAKVAEMREACADAILEEGLVAMEVKQKLIKVGNSKLRDVLYLYFCEGMDLRDIAPKVGYSYRHTERLFGQALQDYGGMGTPS